MKECGICGNNRDNKTYIAREMMFGTGEAFAFIECAACGCLQLADVPTDLSGYYPSDYYSLQPLFEKKVSGMAGYVKRKYAAHLLGDKNLIGKVHVKIHGIERQFEWLRLAGAGLGSSILEVGCGAGKLLLKLSGFGFRNLTGIDPFIVSDVYYRNGVKVLKRTLDEADGLYAFVMMHHAFEHILDPFDALTQLNRLLLPNGVALIRIPVADSYAWEHYKTDWVQLDAPRHAFIHTRKSIGILAERTGFEISAVVCDSTAFQFYGSEQYRNNIPLRDARSYSVSAEKSIFTKEQIKGFEEKAKKLNAEGQGDQACFYLRKI